MRAAVGLGVVMVVVAFVWMNLIRREELEAALRLSDVAWLLPGAGAGVVFAAVVWWLGHDLPAMQRIAQMLARALDLKAMRFRHVFWFSLLAALPEEVLFRGAVQATLGLVLAALIFGALHALTVLYFVYAAGAGLFLGLLYQWTGTLWTPIGAHFTIDLVMFLLLLGRRHHLTT
ncbi:MAG: CPBP family intramembrane metalloprotease [Anaerolineae bacterium]|nr:CPBP family intramembrane metalloprotease [Anaerolineae bacterium]